MTNRDRMNAALKKTVFPYLLEQGFEGKYPHFRRNNGDCIELVSFQTNKLGGSFWVEVSVVFPGRENSNIIWWDESTEPLSAWCTKKRYRLPGMFGGEFYYCDVYKKTTKYNWFTSWRVGIYTNYVGVLNDKAAAQWRSDGYECIKRFDENTADEICDTIIKQMIEAYRWMKKFEKKYR